MGIASTKSRNRRKQISSEQTAVSTPVEDSQSAAPTEVEISERTWFLAKVFILFLAALTRLYDLNLVPLHHDEGVNGNFLVRLVRDGFYHYDPANYHGPTLYYFAAIFPWILKLLFGPSAQNTYGLTTTGIRCVPALFGLATIGLVFTLRRNLGTIATLGTAFLLAVSPGAVYLSRYFIHETLFVFFTLGIVVAAVKYYENPNPVHLILAAVSTALLFATKETAIISAGVLLIAFLLTQVYRALMKNLSGVRDGGRKKRRSGVYKHNEQDTGFISRAGGAKSLAIWVAMAIAVFIALNVLFYSSFFTNYPKGVSDALKTFQFWTKTGKEAHVHPFETYIWWLLLQESPLLVLGTMGAIVAVLKPTKPLALFSALWAFGLLAAYSLIAYKTPWLALNFIVPLALSSGFAIEWLYQELGSWGMNKRARIYALVVVLLISIGPLPGLLRIFDQIVGTSPFPGLLPALSNVKPNWKTFIPGYQSIDLNFINYDNDDRYYVYVYAHTRRDLLKMVGEINRIALRTHEGGQTGITIVSPDYWPLPWYLRDYSRVGYFGRISPSTEPIILASQSQAQEVQATYGDRYQQVQSSLNPTGSFSLRPGVDLLLYTRRELVP
ncbi:MAG: TIGR03663 family protein [Acidobacteriota bacterium]|nr:TIGR03663 family protein [Acidobacteriota bacterium]